MSVSVCVCVGRKYMLVFRVEATDAPLGEKTAVVVKTVRVQQDAVRAGG